MSQQNPAVAVPLASFPTAKNLPDKSGTARNISSASVIAPRLLRIQDAARYLSATNWFVEELIRNNQIRSLVLGKRRVLDVRDLDAWIESEKVRAA